MDEYDSEQHIELYPMSSCPICEETTLSDGSGYHVLLKIDDTTRSAAQLTDEETEVSRYCAEREICYGCWKGLSKQLS